MLNFFSFCLVGNCVSSDINRVVCVLLPLSLHWQEQSIELTSISHSTISQLSMDDSGTLHSSQIRGEASFEKLIIKFEIKAD